MELLQVIFNILKLIFDLYIQLSAIVSKLNDFYITLVAGLFGAPVIVIKIIKFICDQFIKKIKA